MFFACGLNHKTAPLSVREKIAMPLGTQYQYLNSLLDLKPVNEAIILSTCNRSEIYCDAEDGNIIADWLAEQHDLSIEDIKPYFYCHQEHSAIKHALRVASGLDSMMLGEPQIFGQMKQAFQGACSHRAVKENLQRIFQYVFNAGKRIRRLSGVGKNSVSVAFAAVQLINQHFKNYEKLKVFLIGSGETSSLVAKYLKQQGVTQFIIASRTNEHAHTLANNVHGQTIPITEIPEHLSRADVIISATSCPLPFINKAMVEQALQTASQESKLFLDLSVPRDVEPDVAELDGVLLYNIDALHQVIDKSMDERKIAALHAEQLIDDALNQYILINRSLKANTMICDYRGQMQELAQQELNRAIKRLSSGQCQFKVLTEFSERLVNKFTHAPTIALKQAASENRSELLDLAHYLFTTGAESSSSITEISTDEEVPPEQT